MFAALAVGHHIEHLTGWSIKKFVQTARRYRALDIKTSSGHVLTAEQPLPDELHDALTALA